VCKQISFLSGCRATYREAENDEFRMNRNGIARISQSLNQAQHLKWLEISALERREIYGDDLHRCAGRIPANKARDGRLVDQLPATSHTRVGRRA
jgi:hypothetical protein